MPAAESNKRKRPASDMTPSEPNAPDALIPIRVDVTVDNHRVQDTFSWNPFEKQVTPQIFAAMLATDLNLPAAVQAPIVEQMTEQIAAAHSSAPLAHMVLPESRHVVHLHVRIGRLVIRDKFEWDLNEPLNCPDAFSETLCADLGLNTEHVPMVAHALRKQLAELAEFQDKRQSCSVVTESDAVRAQLDGWHPTVEMLTLEEQEKLERKEKREARLQRRNRGKADMFGRTYGRSNARPGRGRGSRRRLSRQS